MRNKNVHAFGFLIPYSTVSQRVREGIPNASPVRHPMLHPSRDHMRDPWHFDPCHEASVTSRSKRPELASGPEREASPYENAKEPGRSRDAIRTLRKRPKRKARARTKLPWRTASDSGAKRGSGAAQRWLERSFSVASARECLQRGARGPGLCSPPARYTARRGMIHHGTPGGTGRAVAGGRGPSARASSAEDSRFCVGRTFREAESAPPAARTTMKATWQTSVPASGWMAR
jgi:hypothetical protein